MKYFKLDLIDDHQPGVVTQKDVLIGVLMSRGLVPRVVACFPVADYRRGRSARDGFCLNEVCRDEEHRAHLSRWSTITVTGEQLAELQERGALSYGDGGTVVRLLEEV
jgi:hypothetical protein